MTIEMIFFYIMCGLIFVLSSIAFYYLRLYRNKLVLVEKEYQNAKNIIRNIVITLKSRQEDHQNKIDDILFNIEELSARIELLDASIEDQNKKILSVDDGVKTALMANAKVSQRVLDMDEALHSGVISRRGLSDALPSVEKRGTLLRQEVTKQLQSPVWNESVLDGLTDTEKQVLSILVKEGEKTAPEIEKTIGKTREHTSRLMKKLFREGYVNRNTHKIPYVYRANNNLIEIINPEEQ
jgi:hypothetical protein